MSILTEFKKRVPNFPEQYKSSLFDNISKTGGGSAETKSIFGKHFENNYELYCYSFWLGIKANKRIKFSPGDKKVNFSHAIEFWGRKSNSKRNDFDWIQNALFIYCYNRTKLDLIGLDKGELKVKNQVDLLIETLEEYTYGGLYLLANEIECVNGPLPDIFFTDLLLEV